MNDRPAKSRFRWAIRLGVTLGLWVLLGDTSLFAQEIKNRDRVAVLVRRDNYDLLKESLQQYASDVEKRFPVKLEIIPGEWWSPVEVRATLKKRYTEDHISGAILVGALPMHRFYMHEFPNPNALYYEALDLPFTDRKSVGFDDTYVGPPKLQIWVANMRGSEKDDDHEVDSLKAFLQKTHAYYSGQQQIEHRALAVTGSDWPDGANYFINVIGRAIYGDSGVDTIIGRDVSLDALRQAFGRHHYEFFYIQVHSDWNRQDLDGGGQLSSQEIAAMKSGAVFVVNHGCSNCNWERNAVEGGAPNTGMSWVFGQGVGEAVIGNVRTGMVYGQDQLYDRLVKGDYLGKAYFAAKQSAENSMFHDYPAGDTVSGVTLIGNPFLSFHPTPESASLPEVSSPAWAGQWLHKSSAPLQATLAALLQRAQATLLGNVVSVDAWKPYRGIVPSVSFYQALWNWDSAFHAMAVANWDGPLAREQINLFFDRQLATGQLPDKISEDGGVESESTKPPVMAWAVAVVDHRQPDAQFLERIYPKLVTLTDFWVKYRGGGQDGLFFYAGSHVGWDSGWDNSIRWDNGYLDSQSDEHRLWAIDLNCYMVMHYRSLAYLASRLHLPQDQSKWLAEAEKLQNLINEKLWDDQLGFYVDRDRITHQNGPSASIAGFMPLFIHIASPERAARMQRLAIDPKKFFPGMPTSPYDDPKFNSTDYWRGPAWLNTSYFALKGLRDYGYRDSAETMRSCLLGWVSRNSSSIREYYNSRTGEGQRAEGFGWSSAFVIAFILDWDNDHLNWFFPHTQTDSGLRSNQ